MKVYLVSKVICWSDEKMEKDFHCFSDIETALSFKDRLVDLYIAEQCDIYDCEHNDLELLENYLDVTHNGKMLFATLSCDGTEELEIEVTELELQ